MTGKKYLSGGKKILKTIVIVVLVVFVFILTKPALAKEKVPQPYFLFPSAGNYQTPTSLPLLAGETRNDTLVNIYIDGQLAGAAKVVNGPLLTGYFTFRVTEHLLSGDHVVKAMAVDQYHPENSNQSTEFNLRIIPFPSPTLFAVQENSQGQLVISGVAKNDSTIRIYADGKLATTFIATNHPSGTTSFTWTTNNGQNFFATATDNFGKVSLNSNSVALGQKVNLPSSTNNQEAKPKEPTAKSETTEPKIEIAPEEKGDVKVDDQSQEGEINVIGEEENENNSKPITQRIKETMPVWIWGLVIIIAIIIIAWLRKNLNQGKSGEITAQDVNLSHEDSPKNQEPLITPKPEPTNHQPQTLPYQPPVTPPEPIEEKTIDNNQENRQPPLDTF